MCLQLHAGAFKTNSFVFEEEKQSNIFSEENIWIDWRRIIYFLLNVCVVLFFLSNINISNAPNVWCVNYFDRQYFFDRYEWMLIFITLPLLLNWNDEPEHEKPNRKIKENFQLNNEFLFIHGKSDIWILTYRVTVLSYIVKCTKRIRLIHWLVPRLNSWAVGMPFYDGY